MNVKQQITQVEHKEPRGQFYRIAGQDALRLEVNAGDSLKIQSIDGLQGCELLVVNALGIVEPSLLPEYVVSPAKGVLTQLAQPTNSALRLKELMRAWRITENDLQRALCFSDTPLLSICFEQSMTLLVFCCGLDMSIDQQHLSTELSVEHVWSFDASRSKLPAPLAKPLREFRVSRCSAVSYEVKAGEWIQIIDVEGKQCSDFVAIDKQTGEQGEETLLDAVATRTSMGLSLPQPGIYSKFSDHHQKVMLEVVQDTVGRHDSFLYACNSKYYEDNGFFGHVNCTDNFNRALSTYGIKARKGWPSINFFFNTSASECGEISFEEPWSQAGDYVLLRANRDLICASSACPDDIDPANCWNPTDIHVRIYAFEHTFPRSISHRLTPEELPRMTKYTGFHARTSALTKQFIEYKGYWVAAEYENWGARAEYLACREKVAVIDLSALRKFEILGPDAEIFLQHALTRNVRRMSIGEIVYSAVCHETGGMIDDGTLFRLGEQSFRWICGDAYCGIWFRELAASMRYRVSIQDSTEQIHNVGVQGPQSRCLLDKIIWTAECQTSLIDLKWFRFLIGRLGGPEGIPLMVSRTGYTGELGFEVWCHPDHAETVWDAIWQAGEEYQVAPLGFDALDILRIEAGLIFAEHEFCPETNPYEAGIGFTVPLKTKTEPFIGRAAIERQNPESRDQLVGLLIEQNDPVSHGDKVFNGRFPIGVVTSATVSPLLHKQIALCRISPDFSAPGTQVEIGQLDGHIKRISAEVSSLPFYDPERTRLRS